MQVDLQSFLREYEKEHPEDVVRIDKEIGIEEEVSTLCVKLEEQCRYPIIYCTNVVNRMGRRYEMPLVFNLLASRSRCARALGSDVRSVGRDFYNLSRLQTIPPVVVRREEALVKQRVLRGEAIDLFSLPALVHHRQDPGQYFTAGFLTTIDPDSGVDNCSLQRGWIVGPRTMRCLLSPYSHNRYNYDKLEARGEDTRMAYWIGHHPLVCLGAQVRLGYPESHYGAIGGILRQPLRLVPSETLGNDFLVPADAEVVIEGRLIANKRVPEGPFGEYTGYTGPQVPSLELQVSCMTHRQGAHWHDIFTGHADTLIMGSFALEGVTYEAVKQRVPSLKNVYLPLSGASRFNIYLQLEGARRGDAREAIMTALPLDYRHKHVFVFDEDIDIFDERQVMWALATRSRLDRDMMIFPKVRGSVLDPSIVDELTTKGGIDCTIPPGDTRPPRYSVR
ncbi:MAG: UbiD family decarboxylase [Candidatus Tectomicrobia bacterium]|nr:UbiD family decarboxylase [Candidatus Tectomicrobia bacterium]